MCENGKKQTNCVSEKKSKCVCEGQLVLQAHLGPPGSVFSALPPPFYWPRLTAVKWRQIYCSGAHGSESREDVSSLSPSPVPLFFCYVLTSCTRSSVQLCLTCASLTQQKEQLFIPPVFPIPSSCFLLCIFLPSFHFW